MYGTDAIYAGGQKFGLRSGADNFSENDFLEARKFTSSHQAKLFVTMNAFLHNQDFDGLKDYVQFHESIGTDAFIASDLGVIKQIQQHCNIPVHLLTQASCVNSFQLKSGKILI